MSYTSRCYTSRYSISGFRLLNRLASDQLTNLIENYRAVGQSSNAWWPETDLLGDLLDVNVFQEALPARKSSNTGEQ